MDASTLTRLSDLYDAVLDHDRDIHVPCDDSVVRVVGERLLPLRRARGYAPIPVDIDLPGNGSDNGSGETPTVLAVGGELKNTSCLVAAGKAWVTQHLGDMENLATLRSFERATQQVQHAFDATPTVAAVDLHPGYATRRWADREFPGRDAARPAPPRARRRVDGGAPAPPTSR